MAPALVVVTVAGEVVTVVPSNLTVRVDEAAKPEPERPTEELVAPDAGFKVTEATTLLPALP